MASILNKKFAKLVQKPPPKINRRVIIPKCSALKKKPKPKNSIYWLGEKVRKVTTKSYCAGESRLGRIDGSRYKKVEHSPLIVADENDIEFSHESGSWKYTSLPSANPTSKKELDYLLDVTDRLLLNFEDQFPTTTEPNKESILAKYNIWDTALYELQRHTTKQCCQRGCLLNEIRIQIGTVISQLCSLLTPNSEVDINRFEDDCLSVKNLTPVMPAIAKKRQQQGRLPTFGDVFSTFSVETNLAFAEDIDFPDPPKRNSDDRCVRHKKWVESVTDKVLPPSSELADWIQKPSVREAEMHSEVAQLLKNSKQTLSFQTPPPEEIATRASNIRSNTSLPPLPPPDLPDFSNQTIVLSHTTPPMNSFGRAPP